jgi:hypothetical protein
MRGTRRKPKLKPQRRPTVTSTACLGAQMDSLHEWKARFGVINTYRSLSVLSLLLVLPACGPVPQPLTPVCPAVLVPPAAQAWQRSGKSSLELSLSVSYMRAVIAERVKKLLDSTGTFVPEVQSIALTERQQNGRRSNMATVRFAVLLKKQDGTTTPLPGRNYTLLMEIYPQLITPVTMPDATQRKSFLKCGADATCGNNGVILNFYYSELDGGPNFSGRKVDCHASGYDIVDQGVLTGAYQVGSVWEPLPVPLDGVLQFVTDMTKISANVIGVDFGTDQDVKLAIQLDKGNPTAFDPSFTQFSHFPDNDWLLSLDTSLLSSYISSNVAARESQLDAGIVATTPVVAFTPAGITIDGGGSKSAGACGSVPFTFKYTALPKVCSRNGKSVFSMCIYTTQPPTRHYRDVGQEICVGVGSFFAGLFTSGLAEAVISTPCQEKAYLNLQLAQDALYVTKVDLDNQFLVIGRSRLMDASNPGRTVLPQACP